MQKGFTLVELIVVMAILTTLFGLISINLINSYRKPVLAGTKNLFVADMRGQELKAMTNDAYYGIHMNTTSYVLFQGNSYNPNSNTNFTVNLCNGCQFQNSPNVYFNNSSLMINSGVTKIAFVNLTYTFDKNTYQLSSEISVDNPFTNIIAKTSLVTANSTGQITLTVAVDANNKNQSPSGIFEVAKINFSGQTNNSNILKLVIPSSQIVDSNAVNFIINPVGFPNSEIIFTPVSGEIQNWSSSANNVGFEDVQDNVSNVLQINKYGASY